jgi:lipopolysaccharide biosynthesis protein
MITKSIRAIAFHLPQFHPIPENDLWWGKGFTDWTNVAKARPLFEGHYQPHLPSDLGFYDLRLHETRQAQASLAREYGIYGFCYYHYWFNGHQLLERPVNDMLATGKPDFPFCLCWANENWTRRWDGREKEILIKQAYSLKDDVEHIRVLIPMFKDPRYIKVNGNPLFLVYRLSHLPTPIETIKCWREEVVKGGLPGIYLANVESFSDDHGMAASLPLDAAVEFAPDRECIPSAYRGFASKLPFFSKAPSLNDRISSYSSLKESMERKPKPKYLRYRCVTPMWDNAARRKTSATILIGSTPDIYEKWLLNIVQEFVPPTPEENFVFINAWNEWAEGNHLEPCQKWGRAYLEATKRALQRSNAK